MQNFFSENSSQSTVALDLGGTNIHAHVHQVTLVMSYSLRPYGCSPPGSSAHGILQARILEQVAISDLLDPGIEPTSFMSPALASRIFITNHLGSPQI